MHSDNSIRPTYNKLYVSTKFLACISRCANTQFKPNKVKHNYFVAFVDKNKEEIKSRHNWSSHCDVLT